MTCPCHLPGQCPHIRSAGVNFERGCPCIVLSSLLYSSQIRLKQLFEDFRTKIAINESKVTWQVRLRARERPPSSDKNRCRIPAPAVSRMDKIFRICKNRGLGQPAYSMCNGKLVKNTDGLYEEVTQTSLSARCPGGGYELFL